MPRPEWDYIHDAPRGQGVMRALLLQYCMGVVGVYLIPLGALEFFLVSDPWWFILALSLGTYWITLGVFGHRLARNNAIGRYVKWMIGSAIGGLVLLIGGGIVDAFFS